MMTLNLDKLLEMVERLLNRISSKRLLSFVLFLFYCVYVSWLLATKLPTADIMTLSTWGIILVGAPSVLLSFLLLSFTKEPGGDDMPTPAPDAQPAAVPAVPAPAPAAQPTPAK